MPFIFRLDEVMGSLVEVAVELHLATRFVGGRGSFLRTLNVANLLHGQDAMAIEKAADNSTLCY